MMDVPWKAIAPADHAREYLALLTFLPLKNFFWLPRFFVFTSRIQRQLAVSPGIIGYALRAKPLRLNFWTLSVWESEEALMDFTLQVPHVDVMESLGPHMGATRFTRWKIPGAAIPPSWEEAIHRGEGEPQHG